jgi:transposase
MEEYIGLDVSLKETAISIRRGGKRIWRVNANPTRTAS